jgi:hypothetical protein
MHCTRGKNSVENKQRLTDLILSVKRAYKKLARDLHPDRTGDCPKKEEEFKALALAFPVVVQFLTETRDGPPPSPRPRIKITMAEPEIVEPQVKRSYDVWS